MRKRVLSFILALSIILVGTPISCISVQARDSIKTQNDAVAWLNTQNNATYDFDGQYGTQCVEFVKAYVNWLLCGNARTDCWNRPTLNGNEIWKNSIWAELGWQVFYNTADFVPQPGDIFSAGISNGNHTGVVISSDVNTAKIADANARDNNWANGDPVYVHTITWKSANSDSAYGATHFIRPKFASSIAYTSIQEGTYYLKNRYTGTYLNVSYGIDADKTNIHAYTFGNFTAQMVNIKKTSNGYKMASLCSASGRVVNPYADTVVSGKNVNLYHDVNNSTQWWKFQKIGSGYYIRNVQNPNVCLSVNKNNSDIIVSTYTGGSEQIWELEARQTLSYHANNGTNAPNSVYGRQGYKTTLSTQKPSRNGYTFLGWSKSSNATTATYSAGGTIVLQSNTTIYAIWKKNQTSAKKPVVKKVKVKLNKSKVTIKKGQKVTLKLVGTSSKVKWYSSNKKVAKVTQKGKVTGYKKGTAIIKAKVNGKVYQCKVTVKK